MIAPRAGADVAASSKRRSPLPPGLSDPLMSEADRLHAQVAQAVPKEATAGQPQGSP